MTTDQPDPRVATRIGSGGARRSRLLIADDDPVVRSTLNLSLSDEFELVGAACDAEEAIELARSEQPDVALIDLDMPKGGGLHAVRGLAYVAPRTAVVVLSVDESEAVVREIIGAGAVCYRRKGIAPRQLAGDLLAAISIHADARATAVLAGGARRPSELNGAGRVKRPPASPVTVTAQPGWAAAERAELMRHRLEAARDRALAAADRAASEVDELTQVRRRGAGLAQLQREMDRSRRASEELVVAFVDADGLKHVNDSEGHLAGDRLLVAVADALRESLRSYDVIMRFGGDEFVCVLPQADLEDVRRRFAEVSRTLAAAVPAASITAGFARLREEDTIESLIQRADEDLLAQRRQIRHD